MTIKWGSCVCFIGLLVLVMGCRTPQPNLKPPKSPEVLTIPPDEPRFATPKYPDQAFDKTDPTRTNLDKSIGASNSGSRGMSGGPGGGGGGMPGR